MSIGLYIHVPFCVRKCNYCDFASVSLVEEQAKDYLQALRREIAYYAANLAPEQKQIASIFVGGGTPTCLKARQLSSLLEWISEDFDIASGAEITTEANPGTVSLVSLKELRSAGFNRISLGVQSTHQELLKLIGRIHSFAEAKEAVQAAREAGFANLNLDLIFGLPHQTAAHWQQSLADILSLRPEHISCYGLQLEEGTPLTRAVEQGEMPACPEELELEMYHCAIETLQGAGYEHYEISNFALSGYQCQHNLLYWGNREYLGLGPAAHSYLGQSRFSNVENIANYVTLLQEGKAPMEEIHNLTEKEQMEETVFLGLRLLRGLSIMDFEHRFNRPITEIFGSQIAELEKKGLVKIQDGHLKITRKGLPLANQVFAEFV